MNNDRHAYLIMAHNQWDVLEQLLFALDDSRNDIFLHIDKKAAPPLERLAAAVRFSKLTFTKRFRIVWGGSQMMRCTVNMLEQAVDGNYCRYHFLSGVDLPLKGQNYLHGFFNAVRMMN